MKKPILLLITLTALLAACAAPPADLPAASPAPATRTATPSATLTPETPTPDAPTVTPLPTIPTFTPTFDVRTIVTATPAPKAECPIESDIEFPLASTYQNEPFPYNLDVKINKYLNEGGKIQRIVQKLDQAGYSEKIKIEGAYRIVDLTDNGVNDLFFLGLGRGEPANVFLCKNGRYQQIVLDAKYALSNKLVDIVDLNLNGIPEIIVNSTQCGSVCGSTTNIFEWDGKSFQKYGQLNFGDLDEITISDIDRNGTKEIILTGGTPACISCSSFVPQRLMFTMYGWNGENFVEISTEFASPEYRFQAIQDADVATLVGKYEEAFRLYNEAIFNEKLEWWSPERMNYEQATYINLPNFTPPPSPLNDEIEYPRLAAYAYYRMVILHTLLGETEAAQVKYASLQEKFPAGSPGHPYAEMATDFWNAWQPSGRMYDACAAAIAYADAQPEILVPLGSDYHGWQSHHYQPADVCPFR
jgi:hypothetical protein